MTQHLQQISKTPTPAYRVAYSASPPQTESGLQHTEKHTTDHVRKRCAAGVPHVAQNTAANTTRREVSAPPRCAGEYHTSPYTWRAIPPGPWPVCHPCRLRPKYSIYRKHEAVPSSIHTSSSGAFLGP